MAMNFFQLIINPYFARHKNYKQLFSNRFLHTLGVDISFGPFPYITRHELAPIKYKYFDMFLKAPQPEIQSTFFLTVFSFEMWISIIFILILISLWMVFHHRINKLNTNATIDSIMQSFGVSSSSAVILKIPSLISLNFAKCLSAIFCFMVAASASAVLISELLTIKIKLPFTGLDDFWNQNDYALCILPSDHAFSFTKYKYGRGRLLNNEKCHKLIYNIEETAYDNICVSPKAVFLSNREILLNVKNR